MLNALDIGVEASPRETRARSRMLGILDSGIGFRLPNDELEL